jgi:uncharacterized protein YggU (UPF0235/DUF167 family)
MPRGGADRIDGVVEGTLKVRVAAPPVDDAANDALIRLIAGELDVPRNRVRLVAGTTNRRKIVEVTDIGPAALRARWPGLDV